HPCRYSGSRCYLATCYPMFAHLLCKIYRFHEFSIYCQRKYVRASVMTDRIKIKMRSSLFVEINLRVYDGLFIKDRTCEHLTRWVDNHTTASHKHIPVRRFDIDGMVIREIVTSNVLARRQDKYTAF